MQKQNLFIPGPEGLIETLIESPDEHPKGIVVINHPHPPSGGSKDHKVVQYLAKSVLKSDHVSVRFNYRGVGESEGKYNDGIGETDDLFAILDYVKQYKLDMQWPDMNILLAGFSFGAFVITNALVDERIKQYDIKKILLVAPPIPRWPFKDISQVPYSITVFQGWHDELFDADAVYEWAKAQSYTLALFNTGHYFHRTLLELKDQTLQWILAKK